MKNQYIDISLPLDSELPVWPGDPNAIIERVSSIGQGDGHNSSRINSSLHWGTHLDAPYHIVETGWTIDQIPLALLIGPVRIIEIPEVRGITADHLRNFKIQGCKRLLVKTRNSAFWDETPLRFHQDYTAFTIDAAEYLLECNIELIGIDYLSLDLYLAADLPVHQLLYQQNVIGVEGLDLGQVSPGNYHLICLPLNIKSGDGAPVRAVLFNQ
jgi:arylformamidase